MLSSHTKFHSSAGKRQILIADDESINRELLGLVLAEEYEILYAEDGAAAWETILECCDTLSLVLLDLMMPGMNGQEILRRMRTEARTAHIPAIVLTADQKAEVECLNLGAADFIPKPYPEADIILARVLRTIELSEDRDIIQSTERDELTGLYNREYFYRYAEQFDQFHADLPMDAIAIDINHFHMINERFGTAYGDSVLRRIGEKIRDRVAPDNGIVCRREADTFLVYCPHREDYRELLQEASEGLAEEGGTGRVRLRMGVYANADKDLEVERRFDRAKLAADTVRGNYSNPVALYDDDFHRQEIYAEQLIEDFHRGIAEKQFTVHYQPKFDVRQEIPVLSSAEALVRWKHPVYGTVNPGSFIPLFEKNGLIQELDRYVWREAARQIRQWRDEVGFAVPVSVNVSRVDMYDPDIAMVLENVVEENGLAPADILLEITESAYTQDSEQIIAVVKGLRERGFRVEMDDFGTGYSSLNMISALPIDALKLDMHFVRNAFRGEKDTRMISVIIDISDHLSVPVIAEGVETEEQLNVLRDLGCDIVQGYYFSKPVPAGEFSAFLTNALEQRRAAHEAEEAAAAAEEEEEAAVPMPEITGAPVKRGERGTPLWLISVLFAVLAFMAAVVLFVSDWVIERRYRDLDTAAARYIEARDAAEELRFGSDDLTEHARSFIATGNTEYAREYFEALNVTRRRETGVEMLNDLLPGSSLHIQDAVREGLRLSDELAEVELTAMKLTQIAYGIPDADVPPEIAAATLPPELAALPQEEARAVALDLMNNKDYHDYKNRIYEAVDNSSGALVAESSRQLALAEARLARLLRVQTLTTVMFLLLALLMTLFITREVRVPLTRIVEKMRAGLPAKIAGASELRFVAGTYNQFLEATQQSHRKLTYEVSHDTLTGLYNRSAYEMFMESIDTRNVALLIVDVDDFKSINDTYGHDMGDRVLRRVADILKESFRSVDILCRVGGDEFVVIMTRANSSLKQLVANKISHANDLLQNPKDGLPRVSLSVGVAFSDRENPEGDLFKDADTALYRVKNAGRHGCAFYE